MIATLLLLALLLASQVLARRSRSTPPADQVSLAARLAEPRLMAPQLLRFQGRPLLKPTNWEKAWAQFPAPWDRAMVALLAAEAGDRTLLDRMPATPPDPLGRALRQVYEGDPPLTPQERASALKGLGPTYAGRLLDSKFLEGEGRSGDAERARAQEGLIRRLWILTGLGSLLVLGGLGGLGFALYHMVLGPRELPPLPQWPLEGRATALLLLAWFCALLFSGSLVSLLVQPLPGPWRILGLPLAYGLHAAFGIWMLKGFSGMDPFNILRPPKTQRWGRALGWTIGFSGLAVATVFLVNLLLSPLLPRGQPPQKELLEALAALRGFSSTCLLFLTVAGLAPAFEELFFRGFLLPWMAVRWGKAWALVATSLLFGLIHLVPSGLPTLSALGLVLGLAFLRTADIRVCILVHGAWNGAVFLFTRWALNP